jgi:hypothetical protein
MKFLKILGIGGVLCLVLLFIASNFSEVKSKYQCEGRAGVKEMKVFVKLSEYRWFVRLWSTSDGAMWTEVPNELYGFYPRLQSIGDNYQIFSDLQGGNPAGQFSTLSNALRLNMIGEGEFEGICQKIE